MYMHILYICIERDGYIYICIHICIYIYIVYTYIIISGACELGARWGAESNQPVFT